MRRKKAAPLTPTGRWMIGEDGKRYQVQIGNMRASLQAFPEKKNKRGRLKRRIIGHWRLSREPENTRASFIAALLECSEEHVRKTVREAGLRKK